MKWKSPIHSPRGLSMANIWWLDRLIRACFETELGACMGGVISGLYSPLESGKESNLLTKWQALLQVLNFKSLNILRQTNVEFLLFETSPTALDCLIRPLGPLRAQCALACVPSTVCRNTAWEKQDKSFNSSKSYLSSPHLFVNLSVSIVEKPKIRIYRAIKWQRKRNWRHNDLHVRKNALNCPFSCTTGDDTLRGVRIWACGLQ